MNTTEEFLDVKIEHDDFGFIVTLRISCIPKTTIDGKLTILVASKVVDCVQTSGEVSEKSNGIILSLLDGKK